MKEGKRREEWKKTGRSKDILLRNGGQGTADGRIREIVKEEEEMRKER